MAQQTHAFLLMPLLLLPSSLLLAQERHRLMKQEGSSVTQLQTCIMCTGNEGGLRTDMYVCAQALSLQPSCCVVWCTCKEASRGSSKRLRTQGGPAKGVRLPRAPWFTSVQHLISPLRGLLRKPMRSTKSALPGSKAPSPGQKRRHPTPQLQRAAAARQLAPPAIAARHAAFLGSRRAHSQEASLRPRATRQLPGRCHIVSARSLPLLGHLQGAGMEGHTG